jgi:hypothetical protein
MLSRSLLPVHRKLHRRCMKLAEIVQMSIATSLGETSLIRETAMLHCVQSHVESQTFLGDVQQLEKCDASQELRIPPRHCSVLNRASPPSLILRKCSLTVSENTHQPGQTRKAQSPGPRPSASDPPSIRSIPTGPISTVRTDSVLSNQPRYSLCRGIARTDVSAREYRLNPHCPSSEASTPNSSPRRAGQSVTKRSRFIRV